MLVTYVPEQSRVSILIAYNIDIARKSLWNT